MVYSILSVVNEIIIIIGGFINIALGTSTEIIVGNTQAYTFIGAIYHSVGSKVFGVLVLLIFCNSRCKQS